MAGILQRVHYLRVDTPIIASTITSDGDSDDDALEEEMVGDEINNVESRYLKLDKRKKYLFFGYAVDTDDYKQSKNDKIISSDAQFVTKGVTIYTMVKFEVFKRVLLSVENDANISASHKDKMIKSIHNTYTGLHFSDTKGSSHEIEVQDEIRRLFISKIYDDESIDANLQALIIQHCISACPVVRKRRSPPIFVVQHMGSCWNLTQYPQALSHTMFVGVPVQITSECNLQYNVSVLFDIPHGASIVEDEYEEEDNSYEEEDSTEDGHLNRAKRGNRKK